MLCYTIENPYFIVLKDTIMEQWLPCPGHEIKYRVSTFGNVKSVPYYRMDGVFQRGKLLSQFPASNGYSYVWIWDGGKRYKYNVHRLIAKAFLKNPDNKFTVNHINGNKRDNRIENLEWATSKENIAHAWESGLSKARVGVDVATHKFTPEQVLEVREIWSKGGITQKALSRKFKMCPMTVCLIVNRKIWSHI